MKLVNLYALAAAGALSASPLFAAEQRTLEGKIVSAIPDIQEKHIRDSYSRRIANTIRDIKKLLNEAEEMKIDLSKEYEPHTKENEFKRNLGHATRSLVESTFSIVNSLHDEYRNEFTESILAALKESEKAFGNHPYRHVLRGRQKTIVQLLAGKELLFQTKDSPLYYHREALEGVRRETLGRGYPIPPDYQSLLRQPIETWEHYDIHYTRLGVIPRDRWELVPPEFREQHQKVAR